MVDVLEGIPEALRGLRQWVVWAAEDRGDVRADGSPKLTKVPYRADGSHRKASSTEPKHWGTFAQACACAGMSTTEARRAQRGRDRDTSGSGRPSGAGGRGPGCGSVGDGREGTEAGGAGDGTDGTDGTGPERRQAAGATGRYAGIGFVFTRESGFVGVDLDGCRSEEGVLAAWGAEIVSLLGSYTEVSPSGTGVHVIVRGVKPDSRCKRTAYADGGDVEIYDSGRFFCMTGLPLTLGRPETGDGAGAPKASPSRGEGGLIHERSEELAKLWGMLWPGKAPARKKAPSPCPLPRGERGAGGPEGLTDDDLLAVAFNAKNGDKFRDLWAGGTGAYGGDESRADLALCCELAFWTDGDAERIDRLFRRSGLMRVKWDRADYAERTIGAAMERTPEGYRGRGASSGSQEVRKPGRDVTTEARRARRERADGSRETGDRDGPKSTSKGRSKAGGEPPHPGPLPPGERGEMERRPLTDLGNAERLVDAHGEDLRFDVDSGQWLIWTGARWERDKVFQVDQLAAEVVRSMGEEAQDLRGQPAIQLFRHSKTSESLARLNAMAELGRERPGIPLTALHFDRDPWLFCCENGSVDLRTGKLGRHRREDLCTHMSPVPYDAGAKCPRWERFLEEVFEGDGELIGFVHRLCGYCLTGDTREQAFVLLTGKGSNGKSRFLEMLTHIMGDYYRNTPATTFMEHVSEQTNDLAMLVGSRLVTATEGEETAFFNEGLMKRLSGCDPVTARFLRREFFTFTPTFKVLFATNDVPRIRSQNYAMKRRVKLIPFNVRFHYAHEEKAPVRDEHLAEKLMGESPGILSWAVRGCLAWLKDGLGTPEVIRREVESLFINMDSLAEFLDDCCVIHPGAKTEPERIWKAYLEWCDRRGVRPMFKQTHHFTRNLYSRDGIEAKKGTGGKRYMIGITLLGDPINQELSEFGVALSGAQNGFRDKAIENSPRGSNRESGDSAPLSATNVDFDDPDVEEI